MAAAMKKARHTEATGFGNCQCNDVFIKRVMVTFFRKQVLRS